MRIIGVTGTKGKTTTTYMVRSILEAAGIRTGLVGTIETLFETEKGEVRIPSANTTPESIVLQRRFKEMADSGVEAVVMEVSSQALMLHRTAGFMFDLGIFTNLSPDHIGPNEHKDFEDYLHCKSMLFQQCRTGILNGDDPHCGAILQGHTCAVETFGLGQDNDLRAQNIRLIHTPGELGISFETEGLLQVQAHVPAPGRFSVYNALCAIAVCRHFEVNENEIREALRQIHVRGRIEMVKVSDDFTLMIDYAHNAMALESLLATLREYEPHRLVCLFGCGGNRSKLRRFEMGEASGKLAELSIITSDNPRDEDPMDIIRDIVTGISRTDGRHVEIPDRKDAIRYAIRNGEKGDIVVLAGKGHEDYQEIKGRKYPMDERVLIREILEEDNGER
jgi:UDP-N-acetylmuramoyl-L-alanyl-D-glutamate--2,6-diaminopimelate ligase